ncbi:MAG: anthranilate synthase component I [Candidatus Koribacter versatilis]|uniref:Anthranilate synthase component 1 n=1 Tax=Candidatus Korobacter versatilis TaxID=658062 RepID=A0A932EPI9_9BACT|nr:anthranilate synthase component I [Candidatus Koribacter versatilis]
MLTPDYPEFSRLAAAGHTLVPVARTISADLETPVSAFLAVAADEPYAFLLESVEGGERIGRYTFLGARPYMVVEARGDEVTIAQLDRGREKKQRQKGSVFEVVGRLLGEHRPAQVAGLPPFTAGAVGYFAYDAVRQLEKVPARAQDDLHLPDCVLMFYDRLLAFDHVKHQLHLVAAVDVREQKQVRKAYEGAVRDLEQLERALVRGSSERYRGARKALTKPLATRATTARERFLKSVARTKEYIAAGDVFQTVLSQRVELEPGVPPFDIYRALRRVNPSPYMYFLRMGETHVLGSSPEMLVKVTGRQLEYHPIAGTRPRSADDAEDRRLEHELRTDEKERAEHVMLVDLGRNDLGRVSDYGSVQVRDLMYVERYSHVMHLVSHLVGRLRPELSALDAFAACFPAGTLTGAPKVRAMEIIEELEPVRRGVYGGSILYADFAGNLDSCIAIRTMLMRGKKAYVQAGAGIVADSVAESEYDECVNKASAVIRAVEIARTSG